MKVLIANWLSTRGGEEKHVADLARYLSARGSVQAHLALPRSSVWWPELSTLPNLNLVDVAYASKLDVRSVWRVARLLRRGRFDLVHVHGARAGWLVRLAAILSGYRKVIWSMHLLIGDHVSRQPKWMRRWYAAIERFLNRRTALIIAVSGDLRDRLLKSDSRLDPAKVVSIPNGIPEPVQGEPVRREEIFPDGGFPLLCAAVGKLQPEKGHDVLIEALGRLPAGERPAAAIAGEGMLRGTLEKMIAKLGLGRHVRLLGFQSNVIGLLRSADVYIMPSRFEGLPIALLEAMALGKPIVATAVNGIPEAVIDGENGLLVPSEDPEALAKALRKLAADPELRAKLGRGAREAYARRFTQDICFGNILRTYETLAA
jgi:glycosyltransferase involved in cell wall biosynthesis